LRPIKVTRAFTQSAPGSILIEAGQTKLLCTASYTDTLPPFMVGQGSGWVTAEYGMLPGSTQSRKAREARINKVDGRSVEIQRLIGRSLRSVINLKDLPEKSFWIDCDVLSADGGTRTLAVSGAYLAMFDALLLLQEKRELRKWPIRTNVTAVSVGLVRGKVMLDLDYDEDSNADVDMNVIMTGDGEFVQVQGGAERHPFTGEQLQAMLEMATRGCQQVMEIQNRVLGIPTATRSL
jgi:ribonuclease PH